jgi:salicylate hydroxylase
VAELLDIDHSPPVYSDANIFYGVIEDPDKIDFVDRLLAQDHAIIQGNNFGECITFRAGPNDKKVQIWAITYPSTAPSAREEWGATDPSSRELTSILSQFPSSHPFRELASHTTHGRLLHFGLFFRKHKDCWSKGRTCLLGDSCHATLPYVGQGANQAIEDAIVLAESLSGCKDHDEAFKLYFERRSRRTKRVVQMANWMGKLYHTQNPLLTTMRDFLFSSFFKGGMLSRAIEKEIVEECPIPVEDFAKYQ